MDDTIAGKHMMSLFVEFVFTCVCVYEFFSILFSIESCLLKNIATASGSERVAYVCLQTFVCVYLLFISDAVCM